MNHRQFAPIHTDWDDRVVERAMDTAIALRQTSVRRSSMRLGPYNGFDGQPSSADQKIKVAVELGLIPKASRCSMCGTNEGRIDYNAEDYGRPLRVAPSCMKCHMALHNRLRGGGYAESWKKRVRCYADGNKWFESLE